jgi:protease IV
MLIIIAILGIAIIGVMARGGGIGEKIAVVDVQGVITTGSDSGGLFSETGAGSDSIISALERAKKDRDVKAVVLRIDSPGGSPAASEEIYQEIIRVKAFKPVYASMGDVAASGGYYVASPCDQIYADKATITGSIGVIFESTDLSGLFKKLGVDMQVVKSGKFKDIGSSNRPMTPEEKQLIQAMINDTFDQFIQAVSDGRHMKKERVRELATGAVYTGRQAKKLGLIDEIGGFRETISAVAVRVGLCGEPVVVNYSRKGGILSILDERTGMQRTTSRDYDAIADGILRRLASSTDSAKGMR